LKPPKPPPNGCTRDSERRGVSPIRRTWHVSRYFRLATEASDIHLVTRLSDLGSQAALFRLLHPEEIGVQLTDGL
jgi:hypothetical protein